MAEVTGSLGGQPVELNNAATEATLRALLASTKLMAAKLGVDAKSQQKIDQDLKKYRNELDKNQKALKDGAKLKEQENKDLKNSAARRQRDEELALKSAKATQFLGNSLEGAARGVMDFGNKLTGVMSTFANMGSSFSGAAATFNHIPIVGGMLGSAFGAVAASADKLQGSFRTASSVGASFGGSIREMVKNASMAGLTFEQYGQVIQKNGESLAFLGGTTSEGAKRLSQLSKTLKQSGLQDDLARLGMSAEDIASGMAQVTGRLSKAGLTRGMSDAQLAKTSADYLKNLDAVSRLTGKNKDALQAEADARMADSQYRLMLAKLDPDGAANLEMLMASIPKEHQAGLKEILATGNAVSDEAQAAMYFLNKTGQNAMQLGQTMRQTGTLTKDQAYAFDDARRAEMKQMAEQGKLGTGIISTVGMYGDSVQQKFTVGILDAAAQTNNLRTAQSQQTDELAAATKAQQANKDSLDPAAMLTMQQEIAQTSNQFNVLLAQHLPQLQAAFTKLTEFVDKYLTPMFDFFMKNIETIALAIGGLIAGITILKGAMTAFKAFQDFKALGKTPGTTPLNPMFVKDVSGPAIGGKGKGKGGKGGKGGVVDAAAKGSVATVGNVAKGAGVAGAVISVGMLASELSDISDREKSGEITAAEAKEERGGSVGGAAGGAAGAWGGAAAGAAIGSVVPVVGTIVGGLIGAALGGWLGNKGGTVIGKAVTAAPKPTTPTTATPTTATPATPTTAPATTASVVGSDGVPIQPNRSIVRTPTPAPGSSPPGVAESGSEAWLRENNKFIDQWVNLVHTGKTKIESVPGKYLQYVKERLDKKPAAATAKPPTSAKPGTPATAAPATAKSSINYQSGAEDLLKQFYKVNTATPAAPTTVTSASTNAPVNQSTQAITDKIAADKKAADAAADAAKKELADKNKELLDKTKPKPNQESAETLLSQLNTSMSLLIKIMNEKKDIAEQQLSVQKGLSGDLFSSL
jgi:hypothetical protein